MLERFQGPDGKHLLIKALLSHSIVCNDEAIAADFAESGELLEIPAGTDLMVQDGEDNDAYLLITGSFSIYINGREVVTRAAGTHVGEMALIEPTARRSATVRATEESVVLKLTEPVFSCLAEKYPIIWRDLALALSSRLRQRNKYVKVPNPRPEVFIAVSAAGAAFGTALEKALEAENCAATVWADWILGDSRLPIEEFEASMIRCDFGILVISPEDHLSAEEPGSLVSRDNLIFELGMCIGAFGIDRSFILVPSSAHLDLPFDTLGLTALTYKSEAGSDLSVNIAAVCEKLQREFKRKGVK